jgi:hypothetical protein
MPRARMADADGGTREWHSSTLPRYARMTVSEDFAPVSPTLDDQLFSAVAHRHGMSSSMRRFGQPLTRRVRRSAK